MPQPEKQERSLFHAIGERLAEVVIGDQARGLDLGRYLNARDTFWIAIDVLVCVLLDKAHGFGVLAVQGLDDSDMECRCQHRADEQGHCGCNDGAKRDLATSRPLAITSRGIQGAGPCKYLAEATNLTYSPQLWERPSIGTTVVFSEQPDQQALTPRVAGDVGEVAELADSGAWEPMAEGGGDLRKDGDGLVSGQIVESLGGVAGGPHGGGAEDSNPLPRNNRFSNQMRR